ncbi:hypothetical protein [Coxiella burnetii]|uniref:Uncharacterized protein n=3 Tax=Coxiella burnetii TaxID=777 RepID=B5QSD0_COXBU|nr:hypothetical protein [Coxiella burnetii]YP_002333003.1 hypothetical protein CBU_1405 [Coxiella burnetii RSA 493]ACI15294.1 hypothetical protein CBU_1405 [Coxiella burnetii RSA 493]ARI66187.1 hypothetical protein B7L74_07245 [Coxiella burnetii]AZV76253.1 hypothetical protein D6219_11245 [Coxiella burnetii]MCF2093899.1 hypothetical protein [Coxiella burnetii]MCF2095932.1 hypothetical protein [Coxiella burnetii]
MRLKPITQYIIQYRIQDSRKSFFSLDQLCFIAVNKLENWIINSHFTHIIHRDTAVSDFFCSNSFNLALAITIIFRISATSQVVRMSEAKYGKQ